MVKGIFCITYIYFYLFLCGYKINLHRHFIVTSPCIEDKLAPPFYHLRLTFALSSNDDRIVFH